MGIFTHRLWDGHHCFYRKSKVLKNNNLKYLYHYVFSKHFISIWILFFFFIIHSTLTQFSSLAFILGFCQPWLRTRMANTVHMPSLVPTISFMHHLHNYNLSWSDIKNPSSSSARHSRKPRPVHCRLTNGHNCFPNLSTSSSGPLHSVTLSMTNICGIPSTGKAVLKMFYMK